MTIIRNAIDSIQIGVEDYVAEDPRRYLSAVRNVTAGILLLYKEKLRQLSPPNDPEIFIKKHVIRKVSDDGTVVIVGKGKSTVDIVQIKERFEQLGVSVNWKQFESIKLLRNDIEHYYTRLTKDNVREILSSSLVLIRDFLVEELNEDPVETLGEYCWRVLLEVADVYQREEENSRKSLKEVDWKYQTVEELVEHFRCPNCQSELLRAEIGHEYSPGLELTCSSCGHIFPVSEILEDSIDELLGGEAFIAAKEGCELPYETCPQCWSGTLIIAEGLCLKCESGLTYEACELCGEGLTVDEQDLEGLCSYHHYQMEKVRDE
jgi:predicted RNA-binding Zn-ribbon protein involved in translation (DUF1610 family)